MSVQTIQIPRTLPVIHLNNTVMFPYLVMPLVIKDKSFKKAIEYALANDKLLGVFLNKRNSKNPDDIDIYEYGTAVSIINVERGPSGAITLLMQGVSRIRIEKITQKEQFIKVKVNSVHESNKRSSELKALRNIATVFAHKIIEQSLPSISSSSSDLESIKQSNELADVIAGYLPLEISHKQELLETSDLVKRYKKLNLFLAGLNEKMELKNDDFDYTLLDTDKDKDLFTLG